MISHTIVRSSLAELDRTQEISDSWECSRHSAQRLQLLRGGLALVVCVQDRHFILWWLRIVIGGCNVVGLAIAGLLVEVGS